MYDPQSLNQLVIDQTMHIHNMCMDHCCDSDQTVYLQLAAQRELAGAVCKAAAEASNAWTAHARRFDVPCPARIRFLRKRAARSTP